MQPVAFAEVAELIDAANAARLQNGGGTAERHLEALFEISRTLAVYGSLAPGRTNHHIVAPLGGTWTEGFVEGDLYPEGWGATLGYSAFRARTGGARVPAHVLVSAALPAAWPALDEFEGAEYRRILVPVFRLDGEFHTVANLYAAASEPPEDIRRQSS